MSLISDHYPAAPSTLVNRLSRAQLESTILSLGKRFPSETDAIVKSHLPPHQHSHAIVPLDIPYSHFRSQKMGLWANVPMEIIAMIINSENLPLSDILTVTTSVCKGWRCLRREKYLWENVDTNISTHASGPHWISYTGHVRLLGTFIPERCVKRLTLTGVNPLTPSKISNLLRLFGDRNHPLESISLKGLKITHAILDHLIKLETINLHSLRAVTIEGTRKGGLDSHHLVSFLKKCPHLTKVETSLEFNFSYLAVFSQALCHNGGNNYLTHLSLTEGVKKGITIDDLLGLESLFPELQVLHLGVLGTNTGTNQASSHTGSGRLHTFRVDYFGHFESSSVYDEREKVKQSETRLANSLNLFLSRNPSLRHLELNCRPVHISRREIRLRGLPPLPTSTGIFSNVRLPVLHTLALGRQEVDWPELAALAHGHYRSPISKLCLSECGGDVTADLDSWSAKAKDSFGRHLYCSSALPRC